MRGRRRVSSPSSRSCRRCASFDFSFLVLVLGDYFVGFFYCCWLISVPHFFFPLVWQDPRAVRLFDRRVSASRCSNTPCPRRRPLFSMNSSMDKEKGGNGTGRRVVTVTLSGKWTIVLFIHLIIEHIDCR